MNITRLISSEYKKFLKLHPEIGNLKDFIRDRINTILEQPEENDLDKKNIEYVEEFIKILK
jgi:hypothetical protein